MKKIIYAVLFVFSVSSLSLTAQENWKRTTVNTESVRADLKSVVSKNTYQLNLENLRQQLSEAPQRDLSHASVSSEVVITVPTVNGSLESFQMLEVSNFSEGLAEKFPSIKAYRGQSVNKPETSISISLSEGHLKAMILSNGKTQFIEPVSKDTNAYVVYETDGIKGFEGFECLTEVDNADFQEKNTTLDIDGDVLRTLRLAVAADGEYTTYFGGVTQTVTAINDLMSVINPIYERDLAVNFEVVADTDLLISTDPSTDPYNYVTQFQNNLNTAVQSEITAEIGEANYDTGILLSGQAGGGNAGCIGCVCSDGQKGSAYAGAVTTIFGLQPEGFYFAMVTAHEMGHQLGANHTYSRSEFTGVNVEPGSGSTIMGYAGVTLSYDVQPEPSGNFHHASIDQISSNLATKSCPSETTIGNSQPTADAGNNYIIPSGTPFKLTGTATDADGDPLSYSWEQMDSNDFSPHYSYPSPTSTDLPLFRAYPPTATPVQYFPPLDEVLFGSIYSTWNMVSTVNRDLNFAFQVRDNNVNGGQTNSDEMTVSVDGQTGPFQITSISKNEGFQKGIQHQLTWDVNGTDAGVINENNVNILLSTDNGETFNTIVTNTPNDGQEEIALPDEEVDNAFVMIEAVNNIFYTVSPLFVIGNQGNIDCSNTYSISNNPLPSAGLSPQLVNINVPDSGIIEDVNIKMDISQSDLSTLGILMTSPANPDKPITLYFGGCSGANMNVSFDQEAESVTLNCQNLTNSQPVEPLAGELSALKGQNMQGDWSFVFIYYSQSGAGGTVNSIELEFCERNVVSLSNEQYAAADRVSLYPNPSQGSVSVDYQVNTGNPIGLTVYDIAGKQVYQQNYDNASVLNNRQLQLSSLQSGMYLVNIKDGDRKVVKKLIIE